MLLATSPELPQLNPTMSWHGMDRSRSCTAICQLRRLAPEDIAALKATNCDPLQRVWESNAWNILSACKPWQVWELTSKPFNWTVPWRYFICKTLDAFTQMPRNTCTYLYCCILYYFVLPCIVLYYLVLHAKPVPEWLVQCKVTLVPRSE